MKAVTIVAGMAGTVAAGHAHKHARHQARDTTSSAWPEWDPASWTTTTTTSSASSTAWPVWDPTTTTTTSASSATWSVWEDSSDPTTTAATSDTFVWTDWFTSETSAAATSTAAAGICVQEVIYVTGEGYWAPDAGTTSTIVSTSYTTETVSPTAAASTTWAASSSAESASWSDPAAWSAWTSSSADSSTSSTWAWTSPSASPSSSGGSSGGLGATSGDTWAMTYSPYTSSGGCKDAGTVASDIAAIAGKGFSTVRVYSTDCSTLANVGSAARTNNLKLILGVFISSTGISGAEGQVTDIVSWAQWDLVELVVVGNEAVFNNYCSASALAGFVSSVKSTIAAAGYTGPVTTTEPIETWLTSGTAFCGVVDVVAANLYAFFNAETTADQAGPFIQSEISELEAICPGKDVYVMETGWPHAGNCNGAACPSPENQSTAINSIKSVVGAKVVFFSYEDDAWKVPGEFDVEQYWGCADVFSGN